MDLYLTVPSKEYQRSFENYVLAYKSLGEDFYYNKYKKSLSNFDEYLEDMDKLSKGIDLEEGYVTTSTFWLIDHCEVVGVVRVRHQDIPEAGNIGYDISPSHRNKGYGKQILGLALLEAEKIGIQEAMVTCNINNIYSKRIIEFNHGKLLGTVYDEEDGEYRYRYSIVTANANK